MAARAHPGLGTIDFAVIAAYVAATASIGAWCRRSASTRENYFLGGRRFGPWIQSFAYFGQAAAADGPVGVATTTFHNGIAGIWSSLLMLFCMPLFWIVVPWMRRLRILTMADFYVERYGSRRMGATYAAIATFGMMGVLSVGYIAVAKTSVAILGGPSGSGFPVSASAIVWAALVATLGNALLGGLTAAFYSSLLQSCLIVVLSLILVPFGLARLDATAGSLGALGAFRVMHARLPAAFFQVFGSSALPDFTWYYVAAISGVAGLTVMTMPNQLVANAAARTESTARAGMLTGTAIKRLCTIAWAVCGLIAVSLYGSSVPDSDLVWGFATRDLLGPVGCGLIGLMLIGLLSALMAASNLLMLTMSGLIVNNLYRPLVPARTEAHYVAAGRIAGATYLGGAALLAAQFDDVLQALKFSWEFFAIFGAAFWLGLKWRRANRAGAWVSILVSATLFYAAPAAIPALVPSLRDSPALALQVRGRASPRRAGTEPAIFWSQGLNRAADGKMTGRGYLYLDLVALRAAGWRLEDNPAPLNETLRLGIRLLTPFLFLVLVSRASRPEPPEALRRFYAKMRTRVVDAEPGVRMCAASAGGAGDPRTVELLFPGSEWEFYRWNREDAWGFALSAVLVAALLGLLALAARVGD